MKNNKKTPVALFIVTDRIRDFDVTDKSRRTSLGISRWPEIAET
jgi:hypothetical protein